MSGDVVKDTHVSGIYYSPSGAGCPVWKSPWTGSVGLTLVSPLQLSVLVPSPYLVPEAQEATGPVRKIYIPRAAALAWSPSALNLRHGGVPESRSLLQVQIRAWYRQQDCHHGQLRYLSRPFFSSSLLISFFISSGVGKTSLLHRYTQNKFDPKNTTSTSGAFFVTKKVFVNGLKVRLQLWDTAGQERFRSMVRSSFSLSSPRHSSAFPTISIRHPCTIEVSSHIPLPALFGHVRSQPLFFPFSRC